MSVSPKPRRQVIKCTFYKVDLAWRRLSLADRQQGMQEFASVIDEFAASQRYGGNSRWLIPPRVSRGSDTSLTDRVFLAMSPQLAQKV